mmetsp:Transcript_174649/g.554304  ORF Transcript_174649/g.554304 Transcript_174649/m.554304 type:complete len:98 (+) Transcript_174649:342-635(+)
MFHNSSLLCDLGTDEECPNTRWECRQDTRLVVEIEHHVGQSSHNLDLPIRIRTWPGCNDGADATKDVASYKQLGLLYAIFPAVLSKTRALPAGSLLR